jgi:ankyrin repeat protein
LESFRIQQNNYIHNALTHALYKNNYKAVKYLLDNCKINLAEMFTFIKENQIVEEGEIYEYKASPNITLKLSISGGNFDMFQFILE